MGKGEGPGGGAEWGGVIARGTNERGEDGGWNDPDWVGCLGKSEATFKLTATTPCMVWF